MSSIYFLSRLPAWLCRPRSFHAEERDRLAVLFTLQSCANVVQEDGLYKNSESILECPSSSILDFVSSPLKHRSKFPAQGLIYFQLHSHTPSGWFRCLGQLCYSWATSFWHLAPCYLPWNLASLMYFDSLWSRVSHPVFSRFEENHFHQAQ